MNRLKFYRSIDEYQDYLVICTPKYEVRKRPDGTASVTVPDVMNEHDCSGVEYQVSPEDGHYSICFVENDRGETVDVIRYIDK